MTEREPIARLRITPSMGCGPRELTISLVQLKGSFRLDVQNSIEYSNRKKRWRVALASTDVQQQITKLKQVSVPAFPVSPSVEDGEYIELTIHGEMSTLTLGWWTLPPEGAEEVAAFADWLREQAVEVN